MFEDILNKHVTIFRKDGNVLVGFVLEVKDGFIKMIEQDNKMIIFSIDCLDLVREGVVEVSEKVEKAPEHIIIPKARKVFREEQPYEFLDDENPDYDEKAVSSCTDEFAMKLSEPVQTPKYRVPTFLRTTEKEE